MKSRLFLLLLFIALSISTTRSTNDIATNYSTNGTTLELSAVWVEYGNISIQTGIGSTFAILSANVATNYSMARSYARIKRDGVVIESFNLSQSTYPITVSYIVPYTETEGSHYYSWESYCTAGRRCQIYNYTFSVQYLKTGDYALLSEVNTNDRRYSPINFIMDNGDSVIGTGIKSSGVLITFNGTLNAFYMASTQTGNITVQVWKDSYANYPPTVADIVGTFSISNSNKMQNTSISIPVSNLDYLFYNVTSVDTLRSVTTTFNIVRT